MKIFLQWYMFEKLTLDTKYLLTFAMFGRFLNSNVGLQRNPLWVSLSTALGWPSSNKLDFDYEMKWTTFECFFFFCWHSTLYTHLQHLNTYVGLSSMNCIWTLLCHARALNSYNSIAFRAGMSLVKALDFAQIWSFCFKHVPSKPCPKGGICHHKGINVFNLLFRQAIFEFTMPFCFTI